MGAAAWMVLTAARPAAADDSIGDDQPPPVAPIAGALTALLPLAVGGALWSQDDQPARQRLGTELILAGFAAAPWIAHLGSGHPRRAVLFGLTSLTTSAATFVAMEARDPFDPTLSDHQRLAFGTLFTASLFAAAIGVIDAFWVATPRDVAP